LDIPQICTYLIWELACPTKVAWQKLHIPKFSEKTSWSLPSPYLIWSLNYGFRWYPV
jgi:hypothetical protein